MPDSQSVLDRLLGLQLTSNQRRLLKEITGAIEADDSIDGRDKRRALRKLRRPGIKRAVLNAVTEEAMLAGHIVVTGEGDVEAQVDWEGLQEFLKFLGPWLIELIGAFA